MLICSNVLCQNAVWQRAMTKLFLPQKLKQLYFLAGSPILESIDQKENHQLYPREDTVR